MRGPVIVLLALLVVLGCGAPVTPRTLDGFEDVSAWQATGSEGVVASIGGVSGARGRAMRLTFDLGHTSGYAVARRALPLELPSDFELAFELRGDLPINNLEVKLIDQTGARVNGHAEDNVWWFRRTDFAFPGSWRHIVVKRRQLEFAWGPAADHTLRRIVAIELVVSAGKGGGKGWVEIDELALRPRPPVPSPAPRPIATAASLDGHVAALAIDGDPRTEWWSAPGPARTSAFTLDLGRERDFSGVLVRWGATGAATDYRVELSLDAKAWRPVGQIAHGDGGLDPWFVPDSSARYIRLMLSGNGAYRLAELSVLEGDAGATLNGFIADLSHQLPRGSLPRGLSGEQPYWTAVGVDGGGAHNSLLSEDGALELSTGATLEPFLETGGAITTWATAAEITQSLVDDDLPIPSVSWRGPAWEMHVTALAIGDPANSAIAARYTVRNRTDTPQQVRLVLAARPFQVNPPKQAGGGVRPITRIAWGDGVLAIDGAPALRPVTPPDRVSLFRLDGLGYPSAPIAATPGAATPSAVDDATGLASGALVYALSLAPNSAQDVVVIAPMVGTAALPAGFDAALAAARAGWRAKLDRVGFVVPAAGKRLVDTLRSSLAYMLVSRDGPRLRPGTRTYAREWIRDGALMSEALLRLGHADVATAFLRWYLPFQATSGRVPCCIETNGAVPLPENDSHGQLIYLAAEIERYTHDRKTLLEAWPHVQAAARYLEQLRQSERTVANQTADRRARYGLLPPTISHEGYPAPGAYSYWDDFWGMIGFREAAWIARVLGDPAAAAALTAQHDELAHDVLASITASVADHKIGYLPGAAELGDYDATSTTIALSPGNALAILPEPLVRATFERAWRELEARSTPTWSAYTPYELRLVGSFIRLGWRERVAGAMAHYLDDQRPRGWNEWAEVVGRELREPRYIGDMPHAWVHSDYARSFLDMFVYERGDHAWVLAAGIPAAWFADRFAIERLATPFGPLSFSVAGNARTITLRIDRGEVPTGGLVFPWPFASSPGLARINGKAARWRGTELVIGERPATVEIALPR